jgi:16S rRNA (cytosine1402-N4)-methyltransferase
MYHIPVLLEEVLEALSLAPGRRVVDATLGGGGHAAAIAGRIAPGGELIGIDQDADARAAAGARLATAPASVIVRLVAANFAQLHEVVEKASVDGVLMDLGVSSHQLDTAERGFAIRYNGVLDMRMDRTQNETAAELLNRLPESEIARILFEYGEESRARRVANEIVARRPLVTTEDLVDAVRGAMPIGTRPGQIHPATKTFQAVRIAVNRELEVLETGLAAAVDALAPGGRLVVIAYHSLEDRIVKTRFAEASGKRVESDWTPIQGDPPRVRLVTKKPITPTDAEVRQNPRARSAKLRVIEKL